MAEFKSRFLELTFYVNGVPKSFTDGRYVTEDKAEIEVLRGLVDAEDVSPPEKKQVAEEKPVRKSSDK
jgi:hypothetical protein